MEHDFHQWLKEQASSLPFVSIGIGDDAAAIMPVKFDLPDNVQANAEWVVTNDMIAEGTHFELATDQSLTQHLANIGRKSIAVSLSDIAAMGAIPMFATFSLQLPRSLNLANSISLYEGASSLANDFNVAIIGGDTNSWKGPLVLGTTLFGVRQHLKDGWKLSDAKVNDVVLVSGDFGGSLHGKHFLFEPQINLSRYLIENYSIHGATDATDSLSLDLMAIGKSSNVGFQIDLNAIPISTDVESVEPEKRLKHALYDGEDFELILTTSPTEAEKILNDEQVPSRLTKIGSIIDGPPRIIDLDGEIVEVKGYIH